MNGPDDFPILPPIFGAWSAQPELQHLAREEDDDEDDDDAVDVEVDDDADEDGNDDDDDEDDDEDPKEALARAREALRKERKLRRAAEKGKPKHVAKPKKKADDEDEDDDTDERVSAAEARTAAANQRFVRTAARDALKDAGLAAGVSIERALKLLDLDDLDIDDDDSIPELADAIDDLKKDSPALFAKSTRRRVPRGAGEGRNTERETKKPMSTTERQAAALEAKKRR